MMNRRKVAAFGSALVFSALAFGAPLAAGAADTSATATITGGNLTFNAVPATAGLGVTLDGTDQTATTTNAMDVWDDTGSRSRPTAPRPTSSTSPPTTSA
jgi:hypothetical protein